MITNLKLTQYRKMRLNKKTKKNLIKKYNLKKKKKRQLLHCSSLFSEEAEAYPRFF